MRGRLATYVVTALLVFGCAGAGPSSTPNNAGVIVFTPAAYSCAGTTQMAWAATLTGPVGSVHATEVWALRADGGERSLFQGDLPVSNPAFDSLSASAVDVSLFCGDPYGPGAYILRLVRSTDSSLLAEGSFTLAP